MTADIDAAVARRIFQGGPAMDGEIAAVMTVLRGLDPRTVIDEVDVRLIRDALDTYRESRRPVVRSLYV